MTKIVILEGSFLSGKSSLRKLFLAHYGEARCHAISEHGTFRSLYDLSRVNHINMVSAYQHIIQQGVTPGVEVLVLDKFHLSGLTRSFIDLQQLHGLESWMKSHYHCLLCVSVHPSPYFPACCVESAHLPKRKLRAFALQDEKIRGG